ncbi:response regulator transcription factor [Nostoc spongiaeforme FACHB-130]|uniref:Response regulator transcription factor n=1 Tax=Nostoc spongiaeforme FACHB-130 TaxID=1357510 RepID=A0ABR8FRM1_9NOSO|nr:response regulator transcription factor [Nostoc spongiaeforme]MBD2594075.1 response regulator transcription factor [Nostoc spongiaeforme FACHB-130]
MATTIDVKKEVISILLVDNELVFRQGIRTLLGFYNSSGAYNFNVVGEASTVEQAIRLNIEQHPALILLDLELPPEDGIIVLQHLKKSSYNGKCLILSAQQEDEYVYRAMQAGAWGYILKDKLATQLCEGIMTIINNKVYLPPDVATVFFRLFQYYSGNSLNSNSEIDLTKQEQEILNWLVQGEPNEQIAKRLYITVATVKAHLTNIFRKLGVTSRTQAIVQALKYGLVCP